MRHIPPLEILTVGFAMLLAVVANLVTNRFLDQIQGELCTQFNRQRRWLRWIAVSAALCALAIGHVTPFTLAALALFSVTAATDFESTYLPPDAFTLGSTAVCLGMAFTHSDWLGLRDAVVAQALCFCVMVFVVTTTSACDSGDIKLAMQFGATCGSLGAVFIGVIGIWLAMVVLLAGYLFRHRDIASMSKVRIPLGPITWMGLLLPLLWVAL